MRLIHSYRDDGSQHPHPARALLGATVLVCVACKVSSKGVLTVRLKDWLHDFKLGR